MGSVRRSELKKVLGGYATEVTTAGINETQDILVTFKVNQDQQKDLVSAITASWKELPTNEPVPEEESKPLNIKDVFEVGKFYKFQRVSGQIVTAYVKGVDVDGGLVVDFTNNLGENYLDFAMIPELIYLDTVEELTGMSDIGKFSSELAKKYINKGDYIVCYPAPSLFSYDPKVIKVDYVAYDGCFPKVYEETGHAVIFGNFEKANPTQIAEYRWSKIHSEPTEQVMLMGSGLQVKVGDYIQAEYSNGRKAFGIVDKFDSSYLLGRMLWADTLEATSWKFGKDSILGCSAEFATDEQATILKALFCDESNSEG